MPTPAHLEPSKLGTKEYWDALYAAELANHADNPADTGTVWFDDSDAEAKLVAFLDDVAVLPGRTGSFLDLGSGNGSLLLALRGRGWRGPMLGVDYSAQSVALARRIAGSTAAAPPPPDGSEEGDGPPPQVDFLEWDVISGPLAPVLGRFQAADGWDVVLDKGTFDAVSLSSERDGSGRRVGELYRDRVLRLVRPGGLFLITSCNWTEAELRAWFEVAPEGGGGGGPGRLVVDGRVEYRSFSFGGVKGQTISSLCFRKEV